MKQLGILAATSLLILACSSKSTSPQARDGATDQGSDTGVGGSGNGGASSATGSSGGVIGTGSGGASNGSGGTGIPATGGAGGIASGGSGGNGGIANDAGSTDGPRDTFSETRADGSEPDGPDATSYDATTGDGAVVVDLRIAETGTTEAGTTEAGTTEAGTTEAGAATCGAAGTACTGQLACSSGDDIAVGCRSTLACQNGTWNRPNSLFIRCGATALNACPNTLPTEGSACTLDAQLCSYPTGTCTCATGCESGIDAGPCQKPTTWHCDRPPPADCPIQAPQLGIPCAKEKTACSYGGYCAQYQVSCQGGYWQPNGFLPFGGCA